MKAAASSHDGSFREVTSPSPPPAGAARWAIRTAGVLAASGVVTSLVVASCIADLDAPKSCPPAPKETGTSCLDAFADAGVGCLTYSASKQTPERVACLAGSRDDCRCKSTDCPPDEGACYPDGDCPKDVTDKLATAQCKRLLPEDVGADLPEWAMCACMCVGCAAVCDGVGPVVGVVTFRDAGVAAPMIFEFGKRMPNSGRLGLYMRVRGLANLGVQLFKGDTADLQNLEPIPQPTYLVLNQLSNEFQSHVLFEDAFEEIVPYEWHTAEDRPTAAAIYSTFNADEHPVAALFELDCVVPFVVPL